MPVTQHESAITQWRLLAGMIVGLILSPSISEAISCDRLAIIAEFATANFVQIPAAPDAQAVCSVTQDISGGRDFHCAWEHDFRAEAASVRFEALQHWIKVCFPIGLSMLKDPSVSHPDFYDLRQFRHGALTLSVSLKDKGAARKTYVFLRVGADNAGD